MNQLFLQGLFIFILLFSSPLAAWAVPQARVELTPDKVLQVGEICQLRIQIEWPVTEGDYHFQLPTFPTTNLTIDQIGESNQTLHKNDADWCQKEFRFTLLPKKAGPAFIGTFQIAYLDPQTRAGGHIDVGALEIRVKHKGVSTEVLFLLSGLSGLVILTGLGVWRRDRKGRASEKSNLSGPLEEKYLAELQSNSKGECPRLGKFYSHYLREKFSMEGPAATPREILKALEHRLSREELKMVRGLIERCEEFSYAGDAAQRERIVNDLRTYLEGKREIQIKTQTEKS